MIRGRAALPIAYRVRQHVLLLKHQRLVLNLVTAMDAVSVKPVQHHFSPKSPKSSPNLKEAKEHLLLLGVTRSSG